MQNFGIHRADNPRLEQKVTVVQGYLRGAEREQSTKEKEEIYLPKSHQF